MDNELLKEYIRSLEDEKSFSIAHTPMAADRNPPRGMASVGNQAQTPIELPCLKSDNSVSKNIANWLGRLVWKIG